MGQYQLRLIAIPDESRAAVMEAARSCGPPLDRKRFNSVLMGSIELPAVIATDDERAKIIGLRQILGDAGAKLELVDKSAPIHAVSSIAEKFSGVGGTVAAAGRNARIAAIAGGVIILLGLGWGLSALLSDGDADVNRLIDGVKTATSAATSTAASKPVVKVVEPPKPKYFTMYLKKIAPIEAECVDGTKPFDCIVTKLRRVDEELARIPKPVPIDAGVIIDSGEIVDVGDIPTPPPVVSHEQYKSALAHRVVRCLADEGSSRNKGDDEVLERALEGLMNVLTARHARPGCRDTRARMYDCTAETRAETCEEVHGRINGAIVERDLRAQVLEWAAHMANAIGDKILQCVKRERQAYWTPLERASVHMLRFKLATALESREDRCTPDDYMACGDAVRNLDCDRLPDALDADPSTLIDNVGLKCDVLSTCR